MKNAFHASHAFQSDETQLKEGTEIMWIPARFNYLVEQGKEKLHLFEVVFKTTLTQTNRKKINTQAESEGYPADILF